MSNLFHNFLIFVSTIVVGLGIGSNHKIPQSIQNKVNSPIVAVSPTAQPSKAISKDDEANKVLLIQKQTYEAYQQC